MAHLVYALQFLCGLGLLATVGPLYLLLIIIAACFGWSEKRKLARGLARETR